MSILHLCLLDIIYLSHKNFYRYSYLKRCVDKFFFTLQVSICISFLKLKEIYSQTRNYKEQSFINGPGSELHKMGVSPGSGMLTEAGVETAMYSSNGTKWNLINLFCAFWNFLACGLRTFLAQDLFTVISKAVASPSRVNRTEANPPGKTGCWAFTNGNGLFAAVSKFGVKITTANHKNYNIRSLLPDIIWKSVVGGGGRFIDIVFSGEGKKSMVSPNTGGKVSVEQVHTISAVNSTGTFSSIPSRETNISNSKIKHNAAGAPGIVTTKVFPLGVTVVWTSNSA